MITVGRPTAAAYIVSLTEPCAATASNMAHCSSKLDEVSRNSILEEAIRREERTMRLNTVFTVSDPRKSKKTCHHAK